MTTLDSASVSLPEGEARRGGDVTVHLLRGDAPVQFAASELLRYLPLLLPGRPLEVYVGSLGGAPAAPGFPQVALEQEGAILVQGDGRRYAVSGGSPTAVLHAAYALLESLGAQWVKPGAQGEVVRPFEGPPPPVSLLSAPAFTRRGLADGCLSWWPGGTSFQGWLEEMRTLVDWMGKMRMNRLFVHFNRLPPGDLSPLLPDLERRGITLELGGHSLPKLLPVGIRETDPEICRLQGEERRPDGNFCTANPRTRQLLAEGARRYAEQLPPADLYHLWSYDAKDDPWCSCPACRTLSAGEQMWRAVTAAAQGVATVRPGAKVSGVLYHESLGAAAGAPEDVEILFAPRERCYLHSIEGNCRRNRLYRWELREALRQRGEDLALLEYYGDPILFGRPANRADLVASDLAAYQAAGVRKLSAMVFGALSWWLYPVQLYAYARGSWDPVAAESALEDYCRATAGEAGGELLARYYRLEGDAAGTHLRFCGYGQDGSWATLPFPPPVPSEEVCDHRAEMKRGQVLLEEAGELLRRAAASRGWQDPLVAALLAHRMEEALHRAVFLELGRPEKEEEEGYGEAFAEAVATMEEAPPELRGVFGTHWMLPWLRRCAELGHQAPL